MVSAEALGLGARAAPACSTCSVALLRTCGLYAIQIITNAMDSASANPKNVASQRGRNPRWT